MFARLLVRFSKYLGWWLLGFAGGLLVLSLVWAQGLPNLQFWHKRSVVDEYILELDNLVGRSISEYLAHEDVIFDEMAVLINKNAALTKDTPLSRYNPTSRSNAANYPIDWNRSFYFNSNEESGLAVLAHGLSDSPYSTRGIGELLHRESFDVFGLRVPGHGTMPGVLQHTRWEDFRYAFELAVDGMVRSAADKKPLVLVGYSNGSALAVDYAIRHIQGEVPHRPDLLILVSPSIRVSAIAKFARFQRWVSYIPGLGKLSWLSNQMEFDPYKYNSFPVAAAEEINSLTARIRSSLETLDASNELGSFPRTIVFQSAVDATIPASSVIDDLMLRRPAGSGDELVLFDVNREAGYAEFINSSHEKLLASLETRNDLPFTYTLITNRNKNTLEAVAKTKSAGTSVIHSEDTGLYWPKNVFSLSHVALPFPPDDPIYGVDNPRDDNKVNLGSIDARGERGVLMVSMDQLYRLRYNPFFSYMEDRITNSLRDLLKSPD
jgi:pimeloyl-ACP methyl ester carboxylesterase